MILFLGMAQPVRADPSDGTWYVAPAPPAEDTPGCGYVVTPCLTINYAISEAEVGTTVIISPGTFTEGVLLNKAITLTGAVMGQAVISTTSAGITVTASGAIISGTTIAGAGSGEGITVTAGLTNVSILNNEIYSYSVGIQLNGGSGHRLQSDIITGNSIGIVAAGDLSFVAHGNTISGNLTAGILFTGTGPITATMSGDSGNSNTFRNNGPYGSVNITVTLLNTNPPINAYQNDWGVNTIAGIESTIFHQPDNAALAKVNYYTLTVTAAPIRQTADGVTPVHVTGTVGGFSNLGGGDVISFTTSRGTLSTNTATTNASGQATVALTSSVVGATVITATSGIPINNVQVATATVDFVPGVPATVTPQANLPSIVANGVSTTTITAYVTDQWSHPVADNTVVTFTTNLGSLMPMTAATVNGMVTATLTSSTTLGVATVTVTAADAISSTTVNFVEGPPFTVTPGASPASITANGTSTSTITATIADQWSHPVAAGTLVTFSTSSGSFPTRPYTRTTVGGMVTATLTSSTTMGTANVTISATTAFSSTVVQFTAGDLTTITVALNPAIVTVGTTRMFTATGQDLYHNAVPITPTWTTNVGTTSMNGVNGLTATTVFTAQTNPAPVTGVITATHGGISGTAVVNIVPGAVTTITLSPNPVTVTVGTTQPFTATGQDQYHNGVPISPTWSSDVGSAAGTANGLTATAIFTAQNTLPHSPDPIIGTITATYSSIPGMATITLVPGAPYTMTLTRNKPSIVVSDTYYVLLTASVRDRFNNLVADDTIVTFDTSLGNLLDQQVPTQYGVASSGVRSTQAGTAYITATCEAVSRTTTVTFLPDKPYSITLQANPVTPTVGSNSVLTATVYDRYHNVADNVITVTFSSNLGNLAPTVVTTTNGVAMSRISDTLTAPRFITATSQPPALAGTATVTFTPDIPFTVALTAQPITQTVGINSVLNVTVTDRFGNWVADSTPITFTTDLTSSIVSPVATTSGRATSLISSTVAGTAHITAANGLARNTTTVTFIPDVPFSMTLEARPISQTVGLSSVLTATVYDRFSNLVVDNTTVTFTKDLRGDILSPRPTMTGVATSEVTITLAGVAHITATTSGAVSRTTTITFTPDAAMRVEVSVNPPNLKAGGNATATITATAVDRYDNPVPGVVLTGTVPVTLGSVSGLGTTDASGLVTGTWKAGTSVGNGQLRVYDWYNDAISGTIPIAVFANDPSTVFVQVISPTLFANSGMTTTITAIVYDVYSNPIPGVILGFSLSSSTLGSVTASSSADAYGQAFSVYTASVPSDPGSGLLIARVIYDNSYISGSAPVTLTADVPCTLTLRAVPTTQVVGVNSVLTATVTDRFGNGVANGTFTTFTTDLGDVGSPRTTSDGLATSVISSTRVGTAHITATSGIAQDTAAVSFVPDVPSTVELQAQPISQTVGLSSALTATVYDRFSNLVADNTTVAFILDLPGDILSPGTTISGVATSRVTTTLASVARVLAVSGAAWKTTTITFTPDAPVTTTVQLGTDTLIVNSNTTTTITATVVDRYNNPVPGVNVTGNLSPTTLGTLNLQGLTDANGQATGTWTAGTVAGEGVLVVGNASVTVMLVPWWVFVPVVMRNFPPVPVGVSLAINGGAANTYQVTVTLQVSATVRQDYVEWMRFSNDNVHWSNWAAFAPTVTWKLASNNGLAMVYAQFMGHKGGISTAISDDILLFKNGDFSQPNLADWTLDPSSKLSVTASTDISVPNSLVALLGNPAYSCDNVPVGYGSLSQTFIMPNVPTGTHLYLSFTYHYVTYDYKPPDYLSYDRFEVLLNNIQILRTINTEGDPLQTCANAPRHDIGPTPFRWLVNGHPGDTMNVVFRLWNDHDKYFNTYTYLDDVHLGFE